MRSIQQGQFGRRTRAFTLIEVLVVVAIIALLVAILLPSLARAREQAKMVTCQSYMKQMGTAFVAYSTAHDGVLPGNAKDTNADWLGRYNPGQVPPGGQYEQPEHGTVYDYMGEQKEAYHCPSHEEGENLESDPGYTYTANKMLAGAKTEQLSTAHHRASDYQSKDHRNNLRAFEGAPLIIDEQWYEGAFNDGAWSNEDGITDRHLKMGGAKGYGNIGFHDTHVSRVQLPHRDTNPGPNDDQEDYFRANDHCVLRQGRTWISGRQVKTNEGMYGKFSNLESAYAAKQVEHPTD